MKSLLISSMLVFGVACASTSTTATTATTTEKTAAAPMPTEEQMMKAWMEAATPGAAHKVLNDFVGSWETTSKFWMGGDGSGEPMVSKGTSEVKWTVDGRFLMEEATGSMMGMPFNGIGFRGYDNFRKRYNSFWIDNMGTAMYTATGNFDSTGRTLTLEGLMDEPAMNQKDKKVKWVYRMGDANGFVFEMYDPDLEAHGGNAKVGEITYTRKNAK